ncbi:MAG: D-alanyl-D-alanine carboxypeptidase family protein [Polymorphobacter sp.]|uniref:D-alanyl-D-alanine carboxypeptidase family protein n=1 Tax=Polymorphobacter sp. TaxID=1909290 RepID=UPI003A8B29EB
MFLRSQVIASLSFALVSTSALAQDITAGFTTPAPYAFMKDVGTNTILYSKDADREIPPASMAKMMTVLVAFDMIKRGDTSLDKPITVRPETWAKWHSQGSTMFLAAGEIATVDDLLNGIVTASGNDACVVLAEGLLGSESAFIDLMNKTAKDIGLKGSKFANTNGWPDPEQHVTARDLARIAEITITRHPDLYKRFYGRADFTWGKTMEGRPITQPNRNPLLGRVTGADGLKTGHTEEAGYGFTGSATQNGRRVVMVLGGLASQGERTAASVDMLSWGFAGWVKRPVLAAGTSAGIADVQGGEVPGVSLVAPRDLTVLVPRGSSTELDTRMVVEKPITAPVAKGQRLGSLLVSVPGRDDVRLPLIAATDVAEAGPLLRFWNWLKGLAGL